MGAGKTTIGRHIAEILGRTFIDIDQEIERRTGASISWIFEKESESGFRLRESVVLKELSEQKALVIATGGGAIMKAENRQLLQKQGIVIYLYTPVEIQLQRTSKDRNRPLLQVEDPKTRLTELLQVRDPFYREVADFIVETKQGDARDLAQQILKKIGVVDI